MASFNIKAVIGANTSPFKRAVGGMKGTIARISAFASAALGGALSISTLKRWGDEFDAIAKRAARLSIGTDSAQRLNILAETAGSSLETLTKGLLNLRKNAALTFQRGDNRYFEDLGLSAEEFIDIPLDQALIKFAKGFEESERKGMATAAAMQLMGRAGQELLPILEAGEKGVTNVFGRVNLVNSEDLKNIEKFNDEISIFWQNVKAAVLSRVSGFGLSLIDNIQTAAKVNSQFWSEAESGLFGFVNQAIRSVAMSSDEYERRWNEAENFRKEAFEKANKEILKDQKKTSEQLFDEESDRIVRVMEDRSEAYIKGTRAVNEIIKRNSDATIEGEVEKIKELSQALEELGGVDFKIGEEEENKKRLEAFEGILQAQNKIIDLKKQEDSERQSVIDEEERVNILKEEHETMKRIAALRSSGQTEQANELEAQTNALSQARSFLESINEEVTNDNLERYAQEFRSIEEANSQAIDEQQIRTERLFNAFRSVGGGDPIAVALSGLSRENKSEEKTKKAIEIQTNKLVRELKEVKDSISDNVSEIKFSKLS